MTNTKLKSEYPDLDKYIDDYGNISYYIKNTKVYHNPYGPSLLFKDGTKQYYINGKCHRLDGPAVIFADGTKKWYLNGKLHRLNAPAIISHNGNQEYFIENQLHRLDGPARILNNGLYKEYYINNIFIADNQKDFFMKFKNIIDSKNYLYTLFFANYKHTPKNKIDILNIKNSLSHNLDPSSLNILKSLL